MSSNDLMMLIGIGFFVLGTWYLFTDFQVNIKKGKIFGALCFLFLFYAMGTWLTILVRIDVLKKYSFTGVISIFGIFIIWGVIGTIINQVKIRRQRKMKSED